MVSHCDVLWPLDMVVLTEGDESRGGWVRTTRPGGRGRASLPAALGLSDIVRLVGRNGNPGGLGVSVVSVTRNVLVVFLEERGCPLGGEETREKKGC